MKRIVVSLFVLTAVSFATVTVDGYALLENQTTHDSIQIVFERTVPSSLLDTAYTATDGNYTIQLETGIYNVAYTKDGYFSESLTDQSFYANTTISSLTLLEHTTLINVPSLFSTIHSAINHAFEGDTVLVASGTYVENITWPATNGIKLIGSGEEDCIIDGNSLASVIRIENGSDALITGFTIQNGYASGSWPLQAGGGTVSYTHLTLTTISSV